MSVTISSTVIVLTYSAARWTFSSNSVPPQSSAPKWSATWPARLPSENQDACTWGTLSRYRRATASIRR
jgi:hypothetical protein